LHSARALHLGFDAQYATASPLAGATSPAHLALVSLFLTVFPSTWSLLLVSLLGMAACGWGLARLGEIEGLRPAERALFVLAGLGTGPMLVHYLNGLETGLALAAVVWALLFLRTGRLNMLAG